MFLEEAKEYNALTAEQLIQLYEQGEYNRHLHELESCVIETREDVLERVRNTVENYEGESFVPIENIKDAHKYIEDMLELETKYNMTFLMHTSCQGGHDCFVIEYRRRGSDSIIPGRVPEHLAVGIMQHYDRERFLARLKDNEIEVDLSQLDDF